MKNLTKKIGFGIASLSLSVASMSALAQERNTVSLAVLGNVADANIPDSVENGENIETDNGFGVGASVALGHMLSDGFGVEAGLSLLNRKRVYGNDLFKVSQNQWNLRVPVLAKLYVAKIISIGVGPYFSTPIGNVESTFQVGDSSSPDFDTDNSGRAELGGMLAAAVNLPISNGSYFFFEARYLRGMTDLAGEDNNSSYTDDIESLIGYRVSL